MSTDPTAPIFPIFVPDVVSVYSGKAGKCCCGCSGIHRYATGKSRPTYGVVNDRQVRRVVNFMNERLDDVEWSGDHAALEVGDRLYIAYF